MKPVFLCSLTFLLLMTNFVLAEGNDSIREEFLFLMDGMKSEREKLHSGVVRGKGTRSITREVDGRVAKDSGPVEYFLAFDLLNEKMRVDRNEQSLRSEEIKYTPWTGSYIETKNDIEYCSFNMNDPQSTAIVFVASPKTGSYDFQNKGHCAPLDLRNAGLFDFWRFQHGKIEFLERIAGLKGRTPNVFVEEKPGIIRLEYHGKVGGIEGVIAKSILWVDKKNGYTIQRTLRVWENVPQLNGGDWIQSDQRISWKQINNVWVPVDISFEENFPIEEKEKYAIAFDWESVNQAVDEEYFTYCDFDIPGYVPVSTVPLTSANGKIDHLGDMLSVCGTKEGRFFARKLEQQRQNRFNVLRMVLIASGLILISVGVAPKIYRRIYSR